MDVMVAYHLDSDGFDGCVAMWSLIVAMVNGCRWL